MYSAYISFIENFWLFFIWREFHSATDYITDASARPIERFPRTKADGWLISGFRPSPHFPPLPFPFPFFSSSTTP